VGMVSVQRKVVFVNLCGLGLIVLYLLVLITAIIMESVLMVNVYVNLAIMVKSASSTVALITVRDMDIVKIFRVFVTMDSKDLIAVLRNAQKIA
jgi:hypothetical protein